MATTGAKLQRRNLLKSAGLALVGIGGAAGTGLTEAKTAGTGNIEEELLKEIERLEPEERSAVVTLLKGMFEPDIDRMFTSSMVDYWLHLTRLNVKIWVSEQEEEKKRQEERAYRDSLPGPEKLEYIVSQLTDELQIWQPEFIREVFGRVINGESGPAEWKKSKDSKDYLIGKCNHVFEGCSQGLREKVVEKYLADVMPALEEKFQYEEAEQAAIDEFIALVNPLGPEEIRDLTGRIRKELLGQAV